MGSGLIEVHHIRFEKPGELLLVEDQEMIQAFSPHASQETFTDSVCLGSSIRRSKQLDPTYGGHARTTRPKLLVMEGK